MKAGAVSTQATARKLNLGSGSSTLAGYVHVDRRNLPGCVDIQADAARLPFAAGSFDQILAESVFEHLADPRPAIAEAARVLRPSGTLIVRVPALGSCAAHLDPTHRYLADLKHWTDLLSERFEAVHAGSVGVRWRASRSLVAVQRVCITLLGWHDLGQCWVLTAGRPRVDFKPAVPPRWWLDE